MKRFLAVIFALCLPLAIGADAPERHDAAQCAKRVADLEKTIRGLKREVTKRDKRIKALSAELRAEQDRASALEAELAKSQQYADSLAKKLYGFELDCSEKARKSRNDLIAKLDAQANFIYKVDYTDKSGPGVWVTDLFYDLPIDEKKTLIAPLFLNLLCASQVHAALTIYESRGGRKIGQFTASGLQLN